MKFYGNANLQQNELQNAVLTTLTSFPTAPKAGQLAFVYNTVFLCVSIANDLPVWIPLSREITAYTYGQQSAAATWTIDHNLNTTSVNVQVYDSTGISVIPDSVTAVSATQVVVEFGTAQSGRAVLVSGHFDGYEKPIYAYTFFQSESSTTWVIQHNLGYFPVVRIFIGNQEVQPLSIIHDSTLQTTVTFSTAQVGYARLQ